MAAKLTRLTHKIVIHLHLVTAVPFAVLAPGGQSGNFRIHPSTSQRQRMGRDTKQVPGNYAMTVGSLLWFAWRSTVKPSAKSSHASPTPGQNETWMTSLLIFQKPTYICQQVWSPYWYSIKQVVEMCAQTPKYVWQCIQKFPDWPPGTRTANAALCH
jgi:hypothetical protein